MKITDIPEFHHKKNLSVLKEDDKVMEAVKTMIKKKGEPCIILDQQNKVAGLFSKTDLLMNVVGQGLDPKTTPLKSVMNKNIQTITPENSVVETLRMMNENNFRHLPIVDGKGRLVGLLSEKDFLTLTWGQMAHHFRQGSKSSFLTHTTPWMLILVIILYIAVMAYWIISIILAYR